MPEVSVVIPLYNKGRQVSRCLDSVFAQTFSDFVVVVVDDGSTDDGPRTVADYDDARLRLVRQDNAGPGAARNRGIRESTAPLVTFLDADDEWLPEFLETAVAKLREHPECGLFSSQLYVGHQRIDESRERIAQGFTEGVYEFPLDQPAWATRNLINFLCSDSIVCRRSLLDEVGGFYDRPGCTLGEDTYLWFKLALNTKMVFLPRPLGIYHTDDSQLSIGRPEIPPPKPYLLDPAGIRSVCPAEKRPQLERLLAFWARLDATRLMIHGEGRRAAELLRMYPPDKFSWQHLALRASIPVWQVGHRLSPGATRLIGGRWIRGLWRWWGRRPLPKSEARNTT